MSGRIFDRELHRDPRFELVALTGDDRMEHVNRLLDRMIRESPAERLADAAAVAAEVTTLGRLIAGAYRPIRPNGGQGCTFCGLGRYVVKSPGFIGLPQVAGHDTRVLVCDHCGHAHVFRVDGASRDSGWHREELVDPKSGSSNKATAMVATKPVDDRRSKLGTRLAELGVQAGNSLARGKACAACGIPIRNADEAYRHFSLLTPSGGIVTHVKEPCCFKWLLYDKERGRFRDG